MATRLEEFFVSLAALPDEVGRSLELVKKLDARVQLLLSETAALSSKCASDRQLHLRPLLTEKQREAITCAKEKVCIALQVMDTLKNCVAALDQELAEMSKDLNPAVKTEAPPAEVTMDLNDVVGRTYCVCRRPSHGLMVACDNANVRDRQCPHEWFHFECVGLQAQPAGQWFCPNCS